jgi:hypothetical protein
LERKVVGDSDRERRPRATTARPVRRCDVVEVDVVGDRDRDGRPGAAPVRTHSPGERPMSAKHVRGT